MKVTAMNNERIATPKATILVVDDNVDVLNSLAAVLEVLHEEILTASNANEALKYLLKNDPAVIVLDVKHVEAFAAQRWMLAPEPHQIPREAVLI